MKKIQELFERANSLNYNDSNGMIKVPKMKGPGFFPGCIGTIEDNVTIDNITTIVLGQDFDTYDNYININDIDGEIDKNKTWSNLKKLLADLKISPVECFFTNGYMGLRPSLLDNKKAKNTGTSPAAKKGAEKFADQCYNFFKEQLEFVKPNVVLVLGKETVKFLTKTFPYEFSKWGNIDSLKNFYTNENLIYNDLKLNDKTIRFVFVIHPSMSNTNRALVWGKQNKHKEVEVILKALGDYLSDNK